MSMPCSHSHLTEPPHQDSNDMGETALNAGAESAAPNVFIDRLNILQPALGSSSVAEKPCGTDPILLLCFCRVWGLTSAFDKLIHRSGFTPEKLGTKLLESIKC